MFTVSVKYDDARYLVFVGDIASSAIDMETTISGIESIFRKTLKLTILNR